MEHLPRLIEDLGIILITAAIVVIVFKKLRQPMVLGYLIAGFLVGPGFPYLPTVEDTQNVSIWAEVGVIFMLFGLGLEFSFRKLIKVGKTATITAILEVLSMLALGYLLGQALQWSTMDSLFLGGILSISSTTIIVRAFEELDMKRKPFTSLVFGVLIVEDLIAILLLVLLSSVAITQSLSGGDLGFSLLKLVFFLVLWFLLGIYLLPSILKRLHGFLSEEMVLIVSVGLCLMMVIVASYAGFTPALGAFVMGSILAETQEVHRIEKIMLPVKDLFSAVFFVSVGMFIDMNVLKDYFWIILLVTFVTVFGKLLSTALGAIISGRSIKPSLQMGMSLAQIGEFSFIIATLGVSLGVTSNFLYPIAVSVSVVTTFLTPYLIKWSDPFSDWLESLLPSKIKDSLARYEQTMSRTSNQGIFFLLWKEYGMKLFLNAVMVVALTLAVENLLSPISDDNFRGIPMNLLLCAFTLIISAPFLWTIFLGKSISPDSYSLETLNLFRQLQVGVFIFKFLAGSGLTIFIVSSFTSMLAAWGILFVAISTLVVFFFSRFSKSVYEKIENRFISNLTENEREEIEKKIQISQLEPWNAQLVSFNLSQNSPLIGKTLRQSNIKEQFGVTVTMLERGNKKIIAPKGDDILLPFDKIHIIGTEVQLDAIRDVIETKQDDFPPHAAEGHFGLVSIILSAEDKFVNKTIRDCELSAAINGLIVGIEREGVRHLNPKSSMTLLPGDLLWLAGDESLIKRLRPLPY